MVNGSPHPTRRARFGVSSNRVPWGNGIRPTQIVREDEQDVRFGAGFSAAPSTFRRQKSARSGERHRQGMASEGEGERPVHKNVTQTKSPGVLHGAVVHFEGICFLQRPRSSARRPRVWPGAPFKSNVFLEFPSNAAGKTQMYVAPRVPELPPSLPALPVTSCDL
ncbi:MAG: hypothetical protein RLZZ244_82 [Verrucomicrobiota bacterium]|jgi:hypothetical protein